MAASGMLGEFVERREEAEAAAKDYENVLTRIDQDKLDSNIHVKPTHLGLKIENSQQTMK